MEISDRGVSHEVPKESNGFWVTVQINWGNRKQLMIHLSASASYIYVVFIIHFFYTLLNNLCNLFHSFHHWAYRAKSKGEIGLFVVKKKIL